MFHGAANIPKKFITEIKEATRLDSKGTLIVKIPVGYRKMKTTNCQYCKQEK